MLLVISPIDTPWSTDLKEFVCGHLGHLRSVDVTDRYYYYYLASGFLGVLLRVDFEVPIHFDTIL